jgi:hypothetical protein
MEAIHWEAIQPPNELFHIKRGSMYYPPLPFPLLFDPLLSSSC